MALNITRHNNFDISAVGFSKLRKNKSGGKAVYLNVGEKKLFLQLPCMRSPYGLSTYTDEASGRTSYSLDLSFDPENADAMVLCEKLTQLDNIIIDTVVKNSKEWLGKSYNATVCREALYKPLVRPGKEQYPSSIKLKILTKDGGEFVPEAYTPDRQRVPLDRVEKGQKVTCIVDFVQIWFIDNKFGVTVRLQQVLLEPSAKLPAFAFIGLDDKDKNDEDQVVDEDEEYDE
ncbi:hypothetical protein [Dishui Lake phycodnavirus 4]|nr:hypothetical protein [Dishui Lake phycodnavirus 4]